MLVRAVILSLIPLASCYIPPYLNFGGSTTEQAAPHLRLQKHPVQKPVSVQDSLDAGVMQSFIQTPQMEHDMPGEERCEPMPNKTRTRPSFYQCGEPEEAAFTLFGGAVTDEQGSDKYPINFVEPIRVFLDIHSDSNVRFDDLAVDVTLYKRSTGWFGCGWMFLPSFGLLSNYEICAENPSCPVSPGRQVLEFTIDPSRLFTRLFRMIHYDMSAYQLVVRVRDNRNPYEELLCAAIQTRIKL